MPGFLRRINGLRRKERLAGSNALVTGSGRITSANATCRYESVWALVGYVRFRHAELSGSRARRGRMSEREGRVSIKRGAIRQTHDGRGEFATCPNASQSFPHTFQTAPPRYDPSRSGPVHFRAVAH